MTRYRQKTLDIPWELYLQIAAQHVALAGVYPPRAPASEHDFLVGLLDVGYKAVTKLAEQEGRQDWLVGTTEELYGGS